MLLRWLASLSLVGTLVFPLLLKPSELLDLALHPIIFLFDFVLGSCQFLRHLLSALLPLLYLRLYLLNVFCKGRLLGQHVKIAVLVLLQLVLGFRAAQCVIKGKCERELVDVPNDGLVDVRILSLLLLLLLLVLALALALALVLWLRCLLLAGRAFSSVPLPLLLDLVLLCARLARLALALTLTALLLLLELGSVCPFPCDELL